VNKLTISTVLIKKGKFSDLNFFGKFSSLHMGRENVDWVHLAQDTDHWLAVVNAVMNFWNKRREFLDHLTACHLLKRDLLHRVSLPTVEYFDFSAAQFLACQRG
jgi:hypothetical protein